MKSIGILIVHGIGEQKRFSMLDDFTTNFYLALEDRYGADACRQVLAHEFAPRLAEEAVWREAPVRLHWRKGKDDFETVFREVHWADLDEPSSWGNWLRFVWWGLTVAATRRYTASGSLQQAASYGMRDPQSLGPWAAFWLRAKLFLVSVFFLLVLLTVGIGNWLLQRISIRFLDGALRLLYDYLGDIKIYQDEMLRWDRIEAASEKSRVIIRRRMITALVRMAMDGEINDYYIVAHSLGTVVAFNGLMEIEAALPNYLTHEMWGQAEAAGLTTTLRQSVTAPQMPGRPLWLKPSDGIDRNKLLAKLRGFLTLGSPLDKFAAVWPRIVPINCRAVPNKVPWHNVADVQDIVGAKLDLFGDDRRDCPSGDPKLIPPRLRLVGGLVLDNHEWADRLSLFSAHTSYWKAKERKKGRLINRLISWVESGEFRPPAHRFPRIFPPEAAKFVFDLSLLFIGLLLVLLAGVTIYLVRAAFSGFPPMQWAEVIPKVLYSSLLVFLPSFGVVLTSTVGRWVGRNIGPTVFALLIIALLPALAHVLAPDLFHYLFNLPQWFKTVLEGVAWLWSAGRP